jgi:hypothetical protein
MKHDDIMATAAHYSEVDAKGHIRFCEHDLINFANALLSARAALATAPTKPVATVRVTAGGYGMELSKYIAYALPEGLHELYATAPTKPRIAKLYASGGTTGFSDYLMTDGSVKTLKVAEIQPDDWQQAATAPTMSEGAREPVAYTSPDRLAKIAKNPAHVDTLWGAALTSEGENVALYTHPASEPITDAAEMSNAKYDALIESARNYLGALDVWDGSAKAERYTKRKEIALRGAIAALNQDTPSDCSGDPASCPRQRRTGMLLLGQRAHRPRQCWGGWKWMTGNRR